MSLVLPLNDNRGSRELVASFSPGRVGKSDGVFYEIRYFQGWENGLIRPVLIYLDKQSPGSPDGVGE